MSLCRRWWNCRRSCLKTESGGLWSRSLTFHSRSAVEQTIDTPATSLVEMIVEVLVARTPEKTQQVANMLVQHAVNTVEVERPKIIKQTGQKTIIQEKINQVTKHVEVPQAQFPNKVNEMPVGVQRQIPMVQTVQKTMEISQLQCIDEAIDDPVVQVPRVQVVEKTVGIPQLQIVEKTAEALQTQTISRALKPLRVWAVHPSAKWHRRKLLRGTKSEGLFLQNPHCPCSSRRPSWKLLPD